MSKDEAAIESALRRLCNLSDGMSLVNDPMAWAALEELCTHAYASGREDQRLADADALEAAATKMRLGL